MKISCEQLDRHLGSGLKPVYVITGDEPLQLEESLDAVRGAAREQGYSERVRLHGDDKFDWSTLAAEADSLSLFCEKKLIDLRLTGSGPGQRGAKALLAYCERLSPDNILLLGLGQLRPAAKKAKWLKTLEKIGVMVEVWPLRANRLPGWITRRARQLNLNLPRAAATILAERCEGNLLACAQYIDRLAVLYPGVAVTEEQVLAVASDSARYESFDLVDYALGGNSPRALRVLEGLREEGVSPANVVGTLAWTVRGLSPMAQRMSQGDTLAAVIPQFGAWANRRALVGQALQRHQASHWWRMLAQLEAVDRMAKTGKVDASWDGLGRIALWIAGTTVFPKLAIDG